MTKEEYEYLRPGDLAIGNDSNTYSITAKGVICEVVNPSECIEEYPDIVMSVKVLGDDEIFDVYPGRFDVYYGEGIQVTEEEVLPLVEDLFK